MSVGPELVAQLLMLSQRDPNDPRWHDVERSIGFEFPNTFKVLAETLGHCYWNEFAFIYNPLLDSYEETITSVLDAERALRQHSPNFFLFPLFPEPNGLYPWGGTDNGDTLFWVRMHDEWPTLIKGPRAPEFEVRFTPCERLLHQIATGAIRSTIIPDLSQQ